MLIGRRVKTTKIKFEYIKFQTLRSLMFSGAAIPRRKRGEKLDIILVALVSRPPLNFWRHFGSLSPQLH